MNVLLLEAILLFARWLIFHALLSPGEFFPKRYQSIRISNCLDPDQNPHSVSDFY